MGARAVVFTSAEVAALVRLIEHEYPNVSKPALVDAFVKIEKAHQELEAEDARG